MGMFNSAKESTFTTELKKIYRGAQEQYVTDAFSSSGTKVYSKCNGCNNPLNMDVRDDLEYYIEISSSGKVDRFYAKDKSFQFAHNGDLLLTEIEGVQKIADLENTDIITISSAGVNTLDTDECQYKLVTNRGSFSNTEDVKEICANIIDDGYVFVNEYVNTHLGGYNVNNYLSLSVYLSDLKPGSYVRVYEDSTKSNLLGEITYDDYPQRRVNINDYSSYRHITSVERILGKYKGNNVYVEASENQQYSLMYVVSSPEQARKTYTGPWIKDNETINKLETLSNNLATSDYYINSLSHCDENNENCSNSKYYVISRYSDPNIK